MAGLLGFRPACAGAPSCRTACPSELLTAPSPTAGPATTSPAATVPAYVLVAPGSSRSRRNTAGCAGCRPGITATGRRITPADFTRAGRHQQLSFAGMTRLGHTSQQLPVPAAGRCRSPAPGAGTQLQLPIPGESLHFDKAHWVASAITNEALQQTRHIAAELAGTLWLEPPDHHRDRPGTGGRARRPPDRRPDRLVRAVTSPALPGPQRHPHGRDPRPRRAPA